MLLKIYFSIILFQIIFNKSEEFSLDLTKYFMRMIGGSETNIKQHPYVVFISKPNSILCTGTIITSKLILSAAHCFCNASNDCYRLEEGEIATVRVLAGASDIRNYYRSSHQIAWVKNVIPHPEFNIRLLNYERDNIRIKNDADMAILVLEKPLNLKNQIKSVSLATPYKIKFQEPHTFFNSSEECYTLGWAYESNDFDYMLTSLRRIDLTLQSQDECAFNEKDIIIRKYDVICTDKPSSENCYGSSGSPLICNNIQIGVGSMGTNCKKNRPGIWSRIDIHYAWIDAIIKEHKALKKGRFLTSLTNKMNCTVEILIFTLLLLK